jgi:hypothetical protein
MKTVAILGSKTGDYLIDLVTEGMVHILSRENVYIQDIFLGPEDPKQNLHYGHYYTHPSLREPNKISSLYDCDFLIANFASAPGEIGEHPEAPFFRSAGKPVVIIDGSDYSNTFQSIPHDLYFKKEYYSDTTYPPGMLNLPFAAKLYHYSFPTIIKDADICMIGSLDSNPLRSELMNAFRKTKMKCTFTYHGAQYEDYIKQIRRHWLCLSAPSASWDTYRYWELPYFACPMLCAQTRLKIDHDFLDKQSCLKFETADEAVELAREYLQKKDELLKIGYAGREVSLKYNLSTHRAQKILDEVIKL